MFTESSMIVNENNQYLHIENSNINFALVVEPKHMEHCKVEQVTKYIFLCCRELEV